VFRPRFCAQLQDWSPVVLLVVIALLVMMAGRILIALVVAPRVLLAVVVAKMEAIVTLAVATVVVAIVAARASGRARHRRIGRRGRIGRGRRVRRRGRLHNDIPLPLQHTLDSFGHQSIGHRQQHVHSSDRTRWAGVRRLRITNVERAAPPPPEWLSLL
jgi:hypothetical protein